MYNNTSSFLNLAPENWEETIIDMLKNEDVPDTPTSIHKVPERLRVIKPEAYTPHYMGLGPYHHWRDDLYAMEAYKIIAFKIVKRQDEQPPTDGGMRSSFDDFVECLQDKDIPRIRASYDRHLGVDDRPLALMMVIDAIFLLQFLQVFMPFNRSSLKLWTRTRRLVDESQSAYHSILQDIMKLENQIPIFVLKRISSLEIFEEQDILPTMLCNTCMKLSPFKLHHNRHNLKREPTKYVHLLDLLYYLIVPEKSCNNDNSTSQRYRDDDAREDEVAFETRERRKKLGDCLPNIPPPKLLGNNNIKFLSNSRPWKAIDKMASLVSAVIPCLPSLFSSQQEGGKSNDVENGGSSNNSCEGNNGKKAPKVDEIEIPSVKELRSVGIEFHPVDTHSPIESIEFNKRSRKFYLPSITIDDNTEVIIRNLVAYEAVGVHGPLVLARYTELMNGIIDSPEDVKHLRQRKIIVSYLKKDEDVAQLWNGMSRSIRLSHVHSIDKAIKEANEYFHNKAKVKFLRISKECMLCGWKISMLLLTLVLLVLMAIQSFCQVYKCPGALRPVTESGP